MIEIFKKKRGSDERGFTLVEMLVVIFIIGILATMAIGGYTKYRKVALIKLSAEGVVASLYEARDGVRLGEQDGTDGAKCYGLKFSTEGGIEKVSAEFSGVKNWEADGWVSGGCGVVSGDGVIDLDDLVTVEDVSLGDGCSILFEPPSGEVYVDSCLPEEDLKVLLNYGEGDDDDYKREVIINLENGVSKIQKITE
jgi:prepilin-type N-terminal cleavage/methylation domain-containing protein